MEAERFPELLVAKLQGVECRKKSSLLLYNGKHLQLLA
jgi:hypothetical protein